MAIFVVATVPGYVLAIAWLDWIGHRRLQLAGFAVMELSFAIIAVVPGMTTMVVPFLLVYGVSCFFTEFGPNMTTFVMPGELYPVTMRTTGHGISVGLGKLGAFIGVFLFPVLQTSLGLRGTLLLTCRCRKPMPPGDTHESRPLCGHAAGPGTDTDLYTIWQRTERRGQLQGPVRPVSVIEIFVLAQHDHQVPLIPDQGPVQQLTTAAADPPFHDRIHPRRLNRGADHPDARSLKHRVECGGKAGFLVVKDELCPCPSVFQIQEQVPGLLNYPRLDRMLGGSKDPDAAGAVLDDGQDVDLSGLAR